MLTEIDHGQEHAKFQLARSSISHEQEREEQGRNCARMVLLNTDGLAEDVASSVENDTLFSVTRMADLLQSGSDSQRTVILFELQQLLDHCLEDTINVLIPVLCRNIHNWSTELQIAATETLLEVLQQDIGASASKLVCEAALRVVRSSQSEEILEAWGEILVVGLPCTKWETDDELRNVSSILDAFAQSEDDVCRKLAARVYGSFSSCLSGTEVEKYVLPRSLQLVDDKDLEVRGMVAESLAYIGAAVSVKVAEWKVWPMILNLLRDPDARIHAATLRTLAHILEAHREKNHDSLLYSTLFSPVFARECEFVKKAATADQRSVDDDTYLLLEIVSEVFGQFVYAIYPFFPDDSSRRDAYKAFLAMATCNGPIVRRCCAYNMPGVSRGIADKFATELSGIVEFLSRDSDSETRWNIAAGIHETAAILANKSSLDNLLRAVATLLQDENALVRMNTLEHFYPLLESLTRDSEGDSVRSLTPIFRNLTLLSEGNWRTQQLLAQQLEKVCSLVPPDTLQGNVLPLLYQMSEESTYLVRKAAMPAIAKAIWCIPGPQDRAEAVENFRVTWAEGGVFWMRMAFVDCAHAAAQFYSSQLFRQTFSRSVLRLADDPVPNVRLRLAKCIHTMAYACKDMHELSHAISALKDDNDKDVHEAMADYESRSNMSGYGEDAKRMDDERQRREMALFEKMMFSNAREAQKVGAAGKRKFHAPSLASGKTTKWLQDTSQSNETSPASIVEADSSPKSSGVRRSAGLTLSSPKAFSREDSDGFRRRSSWASLSSKSSDILEGMSPMSPRMAFSRMKNSLSTSPQSSSDEENDSFSGRNLRKILSLGKKGKK